MSKTDSLNDNNNHNFTTNDLSVAAFLLTHGYKVTKALKETGGRYLFEIEDHDGKASEVSLNFLSSECFRYDGFVRMLRNMLNSGSIDRKR
jgi:hypothetical protein